MQRTRLDAVDSLLPDEREQVNARPKIRGNMMVAAS